MGAPKAIPATAPKLARLLSNLIRYGVAYLHKTEAGYAEQAPARVAKSLRRRAQELGYALKKIESESASAQPATTPD